MTFEPLTPREYEVASLVAGGLTNAGVAHRLGVSTNTVKAHLTSIFMKLGIESRVELAAVWAREHPEAAAEG